MFFLKFKKLYGLLLLLTSGVVGFGYWVNDKISSMSDDEISSYIKDYTDLEVSFDSKAVNWNIFSIDLELKGADIKLGNDLDIEEGTIDTTIFSFNLLKSIVNLEPTLEKISILKPKISISSKDDKLAKNGNMLIFDQSGIFNIFKKYPDIKKIDVLNAKVITKIEQEEFQLLEDANVQIVNVPGTSAHNNRIIKLSLTTKIEPSIIANDAIAKNLKPLSIVIDSRTEYLQNNPINTNIHTTIKDIDYRHDDLHLHIDELGANIKRVQSENKEELEFSSIYILKDAKKLDLNDLSIKSDINASRLLLSLHGEQLPIHILLPFLGVKNNEIIISDHSINLSNTILSNLDLNAKFEEMSLQDVKLLMKVSNVEIDDLKSKLKYKISSADLDVDNDKYAIDLLESYVYLPSYVCKNTLKANKVLGKFNLVYSKEKTEIDINEMQSKICGIELKSKGSVEFEPNKSPYINITGDFSHKDMSLMLQDMTNEYIDADLLKWLKSSLPSQNKISGDLKFKGHLDQFPFEKKEGLFQVNAYMDNITFDFDPEWERLRHTNVHFNVTNNIYKIKASKGFLDDADLGEATTTFSATDKIDNVIVQVRLNTKLEKIIKYLRKSPLKQDVPNQKQFFLSGNAIADLKLRVPLEDNIFFELDGNARIEDGAIFNRKTKLQIMNNIISNVEIKKGDVSVNDFTVDGDKDVYLNVKGVSKINLRKPGKKAYLKYNSNFEINYIRKDEDIWKWLIKANFDNQRHSISGVEPNQLVSFSNFKIGGEYSNTQYNFRLAGQNSLFGSYLNDVKVDKDKVKIVLKRCNFSYLALYNHIMDSLSLDASDSLSSKRISFELENLNIYSNLFEKINTEAHFKDGNIILDLKDKKNNGKMVYYSKPEVWVMDLNKITFTRNSEELSFDSFMYENHANFKAKISELNVNKKNLGEFEVIYNPRLNQKIYKMKDSLLEQLTNEDSKTNLVINIYSKNFDNFLKEFEFDSKVISKTGEIKIKAKWSLNKPVIKFNDIHGNIDLNLDDGRLRIGPSMGGSKYLGKIISVLNVATLPRRLTLDFKDVTSSDLVFDKISGKVGLRAGHYTTDDLEISTTSAKLSIDGELDYNRRLVDFELSVMPRLTGGIPIIAAVAGGPVVGLAALAANTLIGDNINKLSIKKYRVSGNLDDLEIKDMKTKGKKK